MKNTVKVAQMEGRNGAVKNQFIINNGEDVFFQSYSSIIAKVDKSGKVVLDEKYWDFSKTTGKYRNIFLGEDKKVTEKKIKEGVYTFENLNQPFFGAD